MALELDFRAADTVPVEVEGIVPAAIEGKSIDQVRRLPIYHGNREIELGEFFQVSGDTESSEIVWRGELSGVHWIGTRMESGSMRVEGHAGRHIGSEMSGGSIVVEGNAGDWLGGEMHGGLLHVKGDAAHLVGAAYRGSAIGMTGGTLIVDGDAGNEIGIVMRRGLIAIGGQVGDLTGMNMLAGTILIGGPCGIRHGAGMKRGTIVFLDKQPPPLLPSFRYGCRCQPLFFQLLSRSLAEHQFPSAERLGQASFDLYHGDLIEGGRGEIFAVASA